MARRTRRKYYKRKGRWAGNIRTLTNQTLQGTPGTFFGVIDLATNPVQSDSTVSQTFTVKNIELSYQLEVIATNFVNYIEGLCAYIMYIPEGYTVTETVPNLHPEWIMAYRWLGSPDVDQSTPGRLPSKIKTRMSRRLQSGDRIILLITGTNSTNDNYNVTFNGLLRWWTKAN